MSILIKTSSLKSKGKSDLPKGAYNSTMQTWEFDSSKVVCHSDFIIYMATSTPTTYSLTTNLGKDQDSDDKGT